MNKRLALLLTAALLVQTAPLLAKETRKSSAVHKSAAQKAAHKTPTYKRVAAPATPTPRPRNAAPRFSSEEGPAIDLSHAMPGKALAKLPSSAAQLQSLSSELKQGTPQLAGAKQKSDTLAAEAADLRKKLIDTARRIETLERQAIDSDTQIVRLEAENTRLSAGFANDRVAVTRLIAVLERMQHDMPPALALRSDDALGAARGAMLIGATLPPIYAQAAALSRRIDTLKRTRIALDRQRRDSRETAAHLTIARADLDQLLAQKEREAAGAAESYGALKTQLATIARQAADFQALLARVKQLRQSGAADQSVVTVTAQNAGSLEGLGRNSLLEPVVGTAVAGSQSSSPGLSYATRPGAQVITPADGKVLFAGPYHKSGQVLILEITTGYDVVLAGLGRVTVKPNDQLLAGEPVGTMPTGPLTGGSDSRLYFELRHGGHGTDPSPWLKLNLRASFGKANGT